MDRTTARHLAAVVAVAGFLCTVALAVADVVRISPPWTAKIDPNTFVQADEPAEQPPAPPAEDYDVPAVPAPDEPEPRKTQRRGEREPKQEVRGAKKSRDPAAADEPGDSRGDGGAELTCGDGGACPEPVAGKLEDVTELAEDVLRDDLVPDEVLSEEVLPEPLCGDADACAELLIDSFGNADDPLVLDGQGEDDETPVDAGGDDREPLLACDSEESCAELLREIFGCDSFESCERRYLGAIVPNEDALGPADEIDTPTTSGPVEDL